MPGSIPGTWDTANQTHQKSLPSSLFGIVTMNPPVQQIYPLKKLMYLKKSLPSWSSTSDKDTNDK
jgi:hypothetical protein